MFPRFIPLTLVLVLLAGGRSMAATPAAAPSGPPVRVPDVTSAPHFVADAILALQKKGFAVALVAREDAENRPGYVVDQAPDGLSSRPKGSVIRLTVARRGKGDLTLPDGEAVRLTADTAERLRKSFAGDDKVTVPPVEGRRAIDAMLALQQRGLAIDLDVIRFPGLRVLTVASQGPAARASVAPGTSVEIKCAGMELDATREEIARLTRENQAVLRRAQEQMDAIRATQGRG